MQHNQTGSKKLLSSPKQSSLLQLHICQGKYTIRPKITKATCALSLSFHSTKRRLFLTCEDGNVLHCCCADTAVHEDLQMLSRGGGLKKSRSLLAGNYFSVTGWLLVRSAPRHSPNSNTTSGSKSPLIRISHFSSNADFAQLY